jgi:hypothetical protein
MVSKVSPHRSGKMPKLFSPCFQGPQAWSPAKWTQRGTGNLNLERVLEFAPGEARRLATFTGFPKKPKCEKLSRIPTSGAVAAD